MQSRWKCFIELIVICIYCYSNMQFISYDEISYLSFVFAVFVISFARIYFFGLRIIASQITLLQCLMVAIVVISRFTNYAITLFVILYFVLFVLYNIIIFIDNDYMLIITLLVAYIRSIRDGSDVIWLFILANFVIHLYDRLKVSFVAVNLFLILSFQSNLLFYASILDTAIVLSLFVRDYFRFENHKYIFRFIGLLLAYHTMLCMYSLFVWKDIFYQFVHSLSIWYIYCYYYGIWISGLPFFLEWCNKMNLIPYMHSYYHGRVNLNLLSYIFWPDGDRNVKISDPNHVPYENYAKQTSLDEQILGVGLSLIDNITCSFEGRIIKFEESHVAYDGRVDDIINIFYKKILLSNTSARVIIKEKFASSITINCGNVTTIDIYYLIKNIIKKFGICNDIAMIILWFLMQKNLKDAIRR